MASNVILMNIDFQNFPHEFRYSAVTTFKNLNCQKLFAPMDPFAWITFKGIDTFSYRNP
jgi:hypothetical protein